MAIPVIILSPSRCGHLQSLPRSMQATNIRVPWPKVAMCGAGVRTRATPLSAVMATRISCRRAGPLRAPSSKYLPVVDIAVRCSRTAMPIAGGSTALIALVRAYRTTRYAFPLSCLSISRSRISQPVVDMDVRSRRRGKPIAGVRTHTANSEMVQTSTEPNPSLFRQTSRSKKSWPAMGSLAP